MFQIEVKNTFKNQTKSQYYQATKWDRKYVEVWKIEVRNSDRSEDE